MCHVGKCRHFISTRAKCIDIRCPWSVRRLRRLTLVMGLVVVAMVIFLNPYQALKVWALGNIEPGEADGLYRYIDELEDNPDIETSNNGSDYSVINKVRVICLIFTTEDRLEPRAKIVKVTWARRCYRHYFVLQTNLSRSDIINSVFPERRANLVHKVKYALNNLYRRNIMDFDWLLCADDETYVITHNLKYLLSHYTSSEAGYLGFHFRMFSKDDFMSGEAGYVISNRGVRRLVEFGFNEDLDLDLLSGMRDENLDTMNIEMFFNISEVPRLSSFYTETKPNATNEQTFASIPEYLLSWPNDDKESVSDSQYSVTFHYLKPEQMLLVDHLLYRTSVVSLEPSTEEEKMGNGTVLEAETTIAQESLLKANFS